MADEEIQICRFILNYCFTRKLSKLNFCLQLAISLVKRKSLRLNNLASKGVCNDYNILRAHSVNLQEGGKFFFLQFIAVYGYNLSLFLY